MKPIDINSLLQASASLEEGLFDSFLEYYAIGIKSEELRDLKNLADKLHSSGAVIGNLAGFYVGYKIPQIGKEFDLLRFGESTVLNIELKSQSSIEKIKAQLLRNRYYLNSLGLTVEAFTFESSSSNVYHLTGDGEIVISDVATLLEKIVTQQLDTDTIPEMLFNPSDFLVSPFNSTIKFLADEYFLTLQQEEIKKKILNTIETASEASFIAITGSAGTGKTLLTFDVAKHLQCEDKNVLVIHCGILNQGHDELAKQGWNITSIKNHQQYDLSQFNLVILDEAQRIKEKQLEDIRNSVKCAKCACIFSYDKAQILSNEEAESNTAGKIDAIPAIKTYKLSEKIRTNKEIANFIKMLFNQNTITSAKSSPNISISYFDNNNDAKNYLSGLSSPEWEVLRFTPSLYNNEHHEGYFDALNKNSHEVIGQEFDGVVIVIDNFFVYNELGDLAYKGNTYYDVTKMLFQNITRARRRLNVVIINNQKVLRRCLSILNS